MTAAEALRSMREDIDRLEQKNLVKPGHIARRRAEVDAIAQDLATLQALVDRAEFALADAQRELREADLRIGMLANAFTIMGFSPRAHLLRPTSDADIYHYAAQHVDRLASDAGHANTYPHNRTRLQMKELLSTALLHARLHLGLQTLPQPHATHS